MKMRRGIRAVLGLSLALALVLPAKAQSSVDFVKEVGYLPSLETVKTLSAAEQQALYAQLDALWENGFYAEDQKTQAALEATPQFETLKSLTEFLNNAQISQPVWLESGMLKLSGEDLKDGEDYYYDTDNKELVITGTKPVTVSLVDGPSTDTLHIKGEAQVVLVNVVIDAPEGKSALNAEGGLKLTLVGSNTLKAANHAAVSGQESITLSGTGSLTVLGGVGADGIGAKSLTVTGGTVAVTGGPGTPGTEETAGGDGGLAVGTDVLTVTGGSVKLTGGEAGADGGKGAGKAGEATSCAPTEDGKPLEQTVVTLTDKDGKAVEGTLVTALALSPDRAYGMQGMVTDETGSIYLYLPQETKTSAVSDGSETYTGKPIVAGESGIMTLAGGNNGGSGDEDPTTGTTTETPTTETTTEAPTEAPSTDPKPSEKSRQEAPKLELEKKTGNSVTLKVPTGGKNGALYAYGMTDQRPETNWVQNHIFLELETGKTYYFYAYFPGDDNTEDSPVSQPLAVTLQNSFSSEDIRVRGGEKTYDGKSMTLSVTIPDGAAIRFREGSSGEYNQIALPTYTNAGTYEIGYQVTRADFDTVVGSVTIKISPATPTITLADQTVKHDGNTHPMGGAKITGVNGESFKGSVTYTYYTDGQCTQGETKTPPSAVGTYYVRASIAASGNYTAAVSNTAKLVIEKSSTTTKPTSGGNTGTGYTVTASAGAGGSITQSGKVSVQSGKSASFTIVADKNYEVADVKVDGKSIGSVGVYTFTDVKANHTIEATFRRTVAETTEATTAPTTVPTEATTAPTTETVPETTEAETKPVKKHKIPLIVPILLVVLAGGAIGGAVYIYKRYDRE